MAEHNERTVLGRGLSALLPTIPGGSTSLPITQLEIAKLQRNPNQPRKHFSPQALEELTQSIREKGVLQPLIVRQQGVDQYEVIAGERRLRAATLAGLRSVPVIVRNTNAQDSLEVALIENIQRSDLNPIEEGQAYQYLISQFHLSQEEVAKKVGKNRSTIANSMRLLKLPATVQNYLIAGKITVGQVRPLIGTRSDDEIVAMVETIIRQSLNAREVEAEATQLKAPAKKSSKSPLLSSNLQAVQDKLRRHFGTKVELKEKAGRGQIQLHFYSMDELGRLLKMLGHG